MAEQASNPVNQPLPDGIVPEEVVAHTEKRWIAIMGAMLVVMIAVIVVTGVMGAMHPPSNVEVIDPQTLHLKGEFVNSNLGTAVEPDGSVTVRLIVVQFDFVPRSVTVPADTPITFRITSADAIHGFLLPHTNVNTMIVPGFVAEVRTRFTRPDKYEMPCNEYCGLGHHGMVGLVIVVPKDRFPAQDPLERTKNE